MLFLVVAVAHVLGMLSALSALMSTRTAQGTVAWVISLLAFPYLAVPAYWVFGHKRFEGYVTVRRGEDSALREALNGVADQMARHVATGTVARARGEAEAVERLARMPFLGGNHAELLIDGEATFASLFEGFERARHYLLVQFYIVRDDALGRELQARLIQRAAAGVRVYFLYDAIGSYGLSRAYTDALVEAGVHVSAFQSTRGLGRLQVNFRNHRKITVADGRYGWMGGLNAGDEYVGRGDRPFRDTHLLLEGPSVLKLQISFLEDWHWATGEVLELDWEPTLAEGEHDLPVLVVPSGPADPDETASLLVQQAIHIARRRIWISSPYFVPDEAVAAALRLAVLRGVEARVLIPDRADHLLVHLAAYAFLGPMLDANIQIYRYEAGFLHGKAFLVDDAIGAVSTANLDNRSFRLNFEITALVADRGFAAEVEQMFEEDFERSRRMTQREIDEKSLGFRMAARAAHLAAPVL